MVAPAPIPRNFARSTAAQVAQIQLHWRGSEACWQTVGADAVPWQVMRTVAGLEVLAADPAPLGGRRWALLANHAAVTRSLDPARSVLRHAGELKRLFAPEHGLDGCAQDMEAVTDEYDRLTGLAVRSLYGHTADTLAPRDDDLDDLDAIVVDLPDIGTRHYTFAATVDAVLAAVAGRDIEVIVLDRPNPIGGIEREGGRVVPGYESFVSGIPTPIRHGLTLGEVALLLRRDRHPRARLSVVMTRGWHRTQELDATGLPWVPPSPNMPTLSTARWYPGACLVEATNLSEGRGTTTPFELIGAPWLNGAELVRRLRELHLPGLAFRAARFRPMFGKHRGAICGGVQVHVADPADLRPVAAGVALLRTIRRCAPEQFAWRQEPYEFVADRPAIDLLTGGPMTRQVIEDNAPLEELLESWRLDVDQFSTGLAGILLYR